MRKDVKTGMLIGTGLCLAAAVWFCVHQEVLQQPRIDELLSQKKQLFEPEEAKTVINLTETIPQLPPENAPSIRMHEVRSGQTLSDISKIYYGSVKYWQKIYEANKEQLSKGPGTLKVGMKLVIPK